MKMFRQGIFNCLRVLGGYPLGDLFTKRSAYYSILISCFLFNVSTLGQTIRFYTAPYRCFSSDAVRFIYFENTNTVAKTNIATWAWDFDGNGTFDASGTNVTEMDQTWYATYDTTKATNGVQYIGPVLRVTTFANQTYLSDQRHRRHPRR